MEENKKKIIAVNAILMDVKKRLNIIEILSGQMVAVIPADTNEINVSWRRVSIACDEIKKILED